MGLDAVELILALEESFGIEIPESVAAKMITPAMMISYVQDAVGASPDLMGRETSAEMSWTPDQVRECVRRIISDQLGIEKFDDADEFVRDLGLD